MSSGVRVLANEGKRAGSASRDTVAAAGVYALATVLLGLLLLRFWQPGDALRWMILSGLTLVAILWRLFQFLPENHHPSTQVTYPSLGLANHISMMRGVLLAWLAGFLFSARPAEWPGWLPAVLYTTAIMFDGLDGLAARLTRHVSRLGQRLDIELDGLGILVASTLAIGWGQLPAWYGLVALAYYAFTFGQWLRRKLGLAVSPLSPSTLRRLMAGTQMGFLSAVLWPVLPPTLTVFAAFVVGIPFLAGFTRDWLVVSGQLDVASRSYQVWSGRVSTLFEHWLPVAIRLAVAAVFVLSFFATGQPALLGGQSLASVVWLTVLGALVVAGAAGRIAGVLLAIFAGLAAVNGGITPSSQILIGCGLVLLQLGSGHWSVWQPEEKLLRMRRGGET